MYQIWQIWIENCHPQNLCIPNVNNIFMDIHFVLSILKIFVHIFINVLFILHFMVYFNLTTNLTIRRAPHTENSHYTTISIIKSWSMLVNIVIIYLLLYTFRCKAILYTVKPVLCNLPREHWNRVIMWSLNTCTALINMKCNVNEN